MMRLFASTLAILLCLAAFTAWNPVQPPLTIQGIQTLTQAEFVMSDALTPPVHHWQNVTLPDSWRDRQPKASGLAWYRVPFTLSALPDAPQALYIPRLAAFGEIWLNNALLTPQVNFNAARRAGGQTVDAPIYLILPASAFHHGNNEFMVRMQGDADISSGVGAMRLGPVSLLEPIWQRQHLLYRVLPSALMTLLGATMCFAYAYAYRRKQYALILISLGVGGLTVALGMTSALPLSLGDRHGIRALVFTTLLWLLCHTGCRIANRKTDFLLRLLNGLWLITMLIIVCMMALQITTDQIWGIDLPFIAALALVGALILEAAWQQRSVLLLLLALSGLFWCATVLQSIATPLGWLPWESFRYRSAGSIPLCITLLLFFGVRFVRDREDVIRNQHDAIKAERARILQDMHDGMGAQLITAKRLALRPEVDRHDLARAIDAALQDLRLIIDSLDIRDGDLLPLLGNLRFRLAPGLETLGIRLSWEVQPLPALDAINPAGALAILRIVQEAINNALRHAQPQNIRLVAIPDGTDILIQIIDDGTGFLSEQVRGGRGLSGMRMRAERLNIPLQITSSPTGGTKVSLRIASDLNA